jgi:hypothetical protein
MGPFVLLIEKCSRTGLSILRHDVGRVKVKPQQIRKMRNIHDLVCPCSYRRNSEMKFNSPRLVQQTKHTSHKFMSGNDNFQKLILDLNSLLSPSFDKQCKLEFVDYSACVESKLNEQTNASSDLPKKESIHTFHDLTVSKYFQPKFNDGNIFWQCTFNGCQKSTCNLTKTSPGALDRIQGRMS